MTQAQAIAIANEAPGLPQPKSVEEVGVRRALLEDLALKTIYVMAPPSPTELAENMRLSYRVVDEIFRRLRSEQLVEVTGMKGNTPLMALTSRGRGRALELLALNHYIGPAPVSLDHYVELVRRQSVRELNIHKDQIRRAFS